MDDFTETEPPKSTTGVACSAAAAGGNLVIMLLCTTFAALVVMGNGTEIQRAEDYGALAAFLGLVAVAVVSAISMLASCVLSFAGARTLWSITVVSLISFVLGAAGFGMAVWQLMFRNG